MLGSTIISPFMPYLIGSALVAAVGGGWWLHHSGYQAGRSVERAAWENEATRLRVIAAQEAAQRAAAVNAAHDADTQRNAALARVLAPINDKVKSYADTANGRAVCPSPDGRLLAQQAVTAANASIAASPGARR